MPPLGALLRTRKTELICGIQQIDNVISLDLHNSLQILGAPGTGKTALALTYATNALAAGARVTWISPRAFPFNRLLDHQSYDPNWRDQLDFYRPSFDQLSALEIKANLVVFEHYEHYIDDSDELAILYNILSSLNTPLIITGTLCRIGDSLAPFLGGFHSFGSQTISLSHCNGHEVTATFKSNSIRLSADPETQTQVPDLVPSTWSEPDIGEVEPTPKKRRLFFSGSPQQRSKSLPRDPSIVKLEGV